MDNTNTHRTLSKWEEVEQLKAAGERLVRRAQEDPGFAEQLLREVGYYEAMAHQHAEQAMNGSASPMAPRSKAASAKRRVTKSKTAKARG